MKIVDIHTAFLEELRCAFCKNYLIHIPIRVHSDGSIICNECKVVEGADEEDLEEEYEDEQEDEYEEEEEYEDDEEDEYEEEEEYEEDQEDEEEEEYEDDQEDEYEEEEEEEQGEPYPVPLLETILKNATFSCKYKTNGCDTLLPANFINEHEVKCIYRNGNCMGKNCNWSGLKVDLNKHFGELHKCPNNTDITLTINLKSYVANTLLVRVYNVPFFVNYKYYIHSATFRYKILYVSDQIQVAKYKIIARGKVLKGGECVSFDTPHTPYTYLGNLPRTNSRKLSINIKIDFTYYKWCTIDYKELELLGCVKCGGYLIPFAYDYQASKLICGSCAEDDQISIISKRPVNNIIKSTYFPCKWKDCYFVSQAINIFNHQKTCRYRIYTCRFNAVSRNGFPPTICENQGYLNSMRAHLEKVHNCTYFEVKYSGSLYPKMFTVQQGRIIVVKFNQSLASVDVNVIDFGRNAKRNVEFAIYVQFEHNHCRKKTEWFSISNEFILQRDEVPSCFNFKKQFTVTISNIPE